MEGIHQVLVNLLRTFNITQTYADEYDPWSVILAAAAFAILSTTNGLKGYSLVQLVFGCDMILLIKYTVGWELIRQQKQRPINKDNIRENKNRVDRDYKVVGKVMLNNHSAYKYETPFKGPFMAT